MHLIVETRDGLQMDEIVIKASDANKEAGHHDLFRYYWRHYS